jgi:hypothetical protein
VLLDTLDQHKRVVNPAWKYWGNVEDGGVPKPTRVLAAVAAAAAAAAAGDAAAAPAAQS